MQSTAFRLARPETQQRLDLPAPAPEADPLTERYRPRSLAQMVGQGAAVNQLSEFLDAPHSGAFLFEGPTGVGKTTAALVLAGELGAVEYGGLHRIKSGEQDAEAVGLVLDSLRFTPMLGSGWKVVVVDEADYMSPKARQMWLSALEDLPPRSVIVFTTNHAEKFEQRLLDRCERIAFASDAAELLQDAQALIDDIWWRESGREDAPRAETLRDIADTSGRISFRRVVRALEPLARKARRDPVYPDPREFGGLACERAICDPRTVPTEILKRDAEDRCRREAEEAGYREQVAAREREPTDEIPPAASPCAACGTTAGGIEGRTGRPYRSKGLCRECYNRGRRAPKGNQP